MQVELWFRLSLMLADEFPEMGVLSPLSVGGTATVFHINVDGVDAVWQRAVDGGAEVPSHLRMSSGASVTGRSPTRSAIGGASRSTYETCRGGGRQGGGHPVRRLAAQRLT